MRYIFALLVLSANLSYAQGSVTLTGRILDESRRPLPGVTVRLSGTSNAQVTTDSDGRFRADTSPGKITLFLDLDGFYPLESDLIVKSSLHLDLIMKSMNPAETVIITASRFNTPILESPAAGSVLTDKKIETSPAQNYADLLRSLPGVNASQISTRVFRITTRQVAAAGRIPTELVIVDGRSMNIDLNGAPGWDTIPIDPSQIDKIEVVHGPASVVWGPSAQTGVVNIIEKTPEQLAGISVGVSAGIFDRDVKESSQGNGNLLNTNFVHGRILNDRFSLKVSAGIFSQSPLARPTGNVPVDAARNTGGAPYPLYENLKTTQPKFDFRLDQQFQNGGRLSYSTGVAWTQGTGHSSAGPVIIGEGTYNGYGKISFNRENLFARFIANRVHLPTSFLFVRNNEGKLVQGLYDQQDYGLEAGNSVLLFGGHFLSFGGSFRIASFDLTLAPNQNRRDQFGAYAQDELSFNRFRFVVGGRIDKFNITNFIFSPRIAAIFQVSQTQIVRGSVSRAFRPPTLLENYQDLLLTTSNLNLGEFDPAFEGVNFPIITRFAGNSKLQEETTTALEIGYMGVFRKNTTFNATFYVNKNEHNIRNATDAFYSSDNLPNRWPLSAEILDDLKDRGLLFPSELRFVNSGPLRYHGLELSLEHRLNANVSFFTNYTYQSNPVALRDANPFPKAQLFKPPNHLFNLGADFLFNQYFASGNIQYVGSAFWTDVLNPTFWGPTDAFTMVNASFGRKWRGGAIVTSINLANLFNEDIQQHVFGDIIKRSTTAECRFIF